MDLFVVATISFRLLYGFLILQHSRRQLPWLGVTARPSAHWIARQLTENPGVSFRQGQVSSVLGDRHLRHLLTSYQILQ
jgi:hypothetical protein